MVLELIPTLISAVGLGRSFVPGKHQYLTAVPRFRIVCSHPFKDRNIEIEYYTVDVDGRWSWKTQTARIRSKDFMALQDSHGNRIHASRVVCRSWSSSYGSRPDEGHELIFLSEPYMAGERANYDIDLQVTATTWDSRIFGVDNRSNQTIYVGSGITGTRGNAELGSWEIKPGQKDILQDPINGDPIVYRGGDITVIVTTEHPTKWKDAAKIPSVKYNPCTRPYQSADIETAFLAYLGPDSTFVYTEL